MNHKLNHRNCRGLLSRPFRFAALALLLACFCHGALQAASLPAGFSEATIASPSGGEWNEAVGMQFEDNGRMYVWERAGRVWIRESGSTTWSVLIDITEEVGYWRDFGLLGFTIDPNFRANGYIYLMYVVDRHHLLRFGTGSYNPATDEYFNATIGRITRYTARAADGFTSVDPSSRRVLLGETKSTGPAFLHESHGVGSLVFGTDGTLLASLGDGASYNSVDLGSAGETYYAQALSDGIIRPKENIGAYRSQLVDSLNGKIVRIDPATGDGIPSNPFYDAANPRAARSRVWALGLRNPFRMTLRPGSGSHNQADGNPGVLYIGDVGWTVWEDLNVCTGPGQNFGWPVFEGLEPSSYATANVQNLDAPNPLYPGAGCSQYFYFRQLLKQGTSVAANQPPFNNPCNAAQKIPGTIPQFLHTLPALDWRHNTTSARTWIYDGSGDATDINVGAPGSPVSGNMFPGNCSIGGVWYTGNDFPAQYRNTYFHAEFGEGWIRDFVFNATDKPSSVAEFLSNGGGIVFLTTHPIEGGLYYLAYTSETSTTLRKISYSVTGNLPPTALASSDKIYGPGPLSVQFTGSGSTDPERLPLAYVWMFGDGTPNSTAANPLHIFNAPAGVPTPYTVTLTVTDNAGQTSTTTRLISVNNTPPTVTITSPVDGSQFPMTGNSVYNLTASVTDNESTDNQLQYKWQTLLHHNNHEHSDPINTNHTTTTVISPVGCDGINIYYYRILLTVTDPAGLSTVRDVKIFPDCGTTDTPPTISDVPDQSGFTGIPIGPLAFTIGDAEVLAGNLQLSVSSSNPSVVPISSIVLGGSGAERTVSVTPAQGQGGTAIITVTVNDGPHNISDSFLVTVQPAPLSITTASLPSGAVGLAYTALLNANGGIPPYVFSIANGSFPAGLMLNAAGAISGTPSTLGTFNFTAQVSDSDTPVKTATRPLSIVIAPKPTTVGNTNEGTFADMMGAGWINAGRFQASTDLTATTMFAKVAAISGRYKCAIYSDSGGAPDQLLRSSAEVSNPPTGWQSFPLTSSVALTSGQYYWLAIWSDHASSSVYYTDGAGSLRWAFYTYGAWPDPIATTGGGAVNYCIYVAGTPINPATLTSIAVTPAGTNIAIGATRQFTATGTYSDGSTQNITSQVGWTSSVPAVATINAAGLATGVSVGNSTISATLSGVSGNTVLTVQPPPLAITTTSLPSGTVNTLYNAFLAATGGTAPYTWTIISGGLPAGLSLNSGSGGISGTPPSSGTSNFTVRVTDSGSLAQTTTKALSITINATLSSIAVTPVNPSIFTGGTRQFTATATYSDSTTQNITSQVGWTSSVPAVASINAAGLATAVSVGNTIISATLNGITGTTTLTVQPQPLSITTSSLPGGTVNLAYTGSLAASGGTLPYLWSIASGSLPSGLNLNTSSGAITGTPGSAGTFNFTAGVSDASSPVQSVTKPLSITIGAAVTTIGNTNEGTLTDVMGSGWINAGRFQATANLTASTLFAKVAAISGHYKCAIYSDSGGVPSRLLRSSAEVTNPSTGWQPFPLTSSLTLTNGQFYWFGIWSDSGNSQVYYTSGGSLRWVFSTYGAWPDPIATTGGAAVNYCIYAAGAPVNPATLTSIAVTPAGTNIATGTTQQFTATGTYSDGSTQNITSQAGWTSSVPAVATINAAGLATGVSVGNSTISATLSGVSGNTVLTVQLPPLTITTASLPGGTVTTPYNGSLAATGGTAPYTWAIISGGLPAGLSLNFGNGAISGTPSSSGTSNFTVRATDSGSLAQTTTKALSITINATLSSIAVTPINPSIFTGGTQQFTATATYSDSTTQNITSQVGWTSSVPAVALINAAGLATAVSVGNTIISATLNGITGTTTLTVQPPPLSITTSSLPGGTVNLAYTGSLAASGGTLPYLWSIASGSLPSGLTLNTSSGAIAGTPGSAGTFNFTAGVSDSSNPTQSLTRPLSIIISAATTRIGNTNEGTLSDVMGAGWINAGRFQATANLTVDTMFAKVAAISGHYKCAIYSDSGGLPSRLLRSSAEVTNPSTGWQPFPLTSSLTLTNGQFYWFGIWSDSGSSQVYYTSGGTLRWRFFTYGAWPDPLATTAGAALNYCIYATGAGAPLAPSFFVDTPTEPTVLTIRMVDDSVTITWNSAPGLNYVLEYAESPGSTDWVQMPAVLAIDSTTAVTTRIENSSKRFYRVHVAD